jgi:hypothetical protein
MKLIGIYERQKLLSTRKILPIKRQSMKTLSNPSLVKRHSICNKQTKGTKGTKIAVEDEIQHEETAHLMNFKYFISVKNEPKAISFMNCICLIFIIIFFATVGSLIGNFISVVDINNNILELFKLNLKSELTTS